MGRNLGSFNLKETKRSVAIRLLAEGKNKDEVIQHLLQIGATSNTARQYASWALKQLKGAQDEDALS